MWGALKAIFATPTSAAKVADAVIKGTDAAWFTKQEQSEWFLRYLEATQPQNLSRRIIAISVTGVWLLSAVVLLALTLFGAAPVAEAVFAFMSTIVNPVFYTVVGFYFAKSIAENFGK
jgi:hypothetical protein